jgi:putative transcriptional regulator
MKNRLEVLRKERHLTQEQLAEQLHVSRQTIHSIESQKYLPSITLAFKIARLFDLSIEDVFEYEDNQPK